MTWGELERAINMRIRVLQEEERKQASFHYILADTIGRSVARIYNSSNNMPDISEVYPSLFTSKEIEEKIQEKKDKLTVARFKQFANSHNNKFKEGGKTE